MACYPAVNVLCKIILALTPVYSLTASAGREVIRTILFNIFGDHYPTKSVLLPHPPPEMDSNLRPPPANSSSYMQLPRVHSYNPHPTNSALSPSSQGSSQFTSSQQHLGVSSAKSESYDIVLQPETRPISQEQLVAKIKDIYAGLVMVEAKCIEVDNKLTLAAGEGGLNNKQWKAFIALHRTLLHEHHDFFLASQHYSASPALRRLASKYAMPARMWRHGIHSFLEILRHRLPASLDYMLAFIYLGYSMIALLYETVPAFEDTWIVCLGNLARYRMAIEDDDIRDREVWTSVARYWYSKASDKAPTTGRLYHHLAILARPNTLQQLFYYSKALHVATPFHVTDSIRTLFELVLNPLDENPYRLPPLDTIFVKAHGLLFTKRDLDKFEPTLKEFLDLLDIQIGRVTKKFSEQGCYIAIANLLCLLAFINSPETTSDELLSLSQKLNNSTLETVLQRIGDLNVLSFIHISLVFLRSSSSQRILDRFPWQKLVVMLNKLLTSYKTSKRTKKNKSRSSEDSTADSALPTTKLIENNEFPSSENYQLPEDLALRGLSWTEGYYPQQWFLNIEYTEARWLEVPSMHLVRTERILWLACRIAEEKGTWIKYSGKEFSVCPLEEGN